MAGLKLNKMKLQQVVNTMTKEELLEFLFNNSPENAFGDETTENIREFVINWCRKNKISGKKLHTVLHGFDAASEQH